jgi:hypothetical protein
MRRSISAIAWPIWARRRSCRGRELTLELGAREPQRLELPEGLRSAHVAHLRLDALALELFHPLLNSRIRVDESFAGIAHIFPTIR